MLTYQFNFSATCNCRGSNGSGWFARLRIERVHIGDVKPIQYVEYARLVRYRARPPIAMERLELYECGSFGRKQLVDD